MVSDARHRLVVRGAVGKLFKWFNAALDGEDTPQEVCFWGRAGTGKSWGILSFWITIAHRFPNVPGRILICRATRKSLTQSGCVTMRKVLPVGHSALDGPTDAGRTSYKIGKWEIVLSGLAEPADLYSSEWDGVYVMELRQVALSPWEQFARGIRNNALYLYNAAGELVRDAETGRLLFPGAKSVMPKPWGLCVGCTNPDRRNHWIRRRSKSGRLLLLKTHIEDNPAYYDVKAKRLTPMGKAFDDRMRRTTGIRFRRLVKAEWCSSEGAIWPSFDRDVHVIRVKRDADGWVPREELKRLKITSFYAGKDFGIDDAGVLLWAGYSTDRKLYILAEIYRRGQGVKWWTDRVVELDSHYPLEMGFGDHNRKDWMQEFNDALGRPREGPGAVFVNAPKGKHRGMEIVRRRFDDKSLLFDIDAQIGGIEQELLDTGQPWCTVEEIEGYVYWRSHTDDESDEDALRKDLPDPKAPNDGCDALEYLCVGVEYIDPERVLREPEDRRAKEAYLRKLRLTGRQTFDDGDDEDGDDEGDVDDDDYYADVAARSFH